MTYMTAILSKLRWLFTGVPLWRPGFNSKAVHVGFVRGGGRWGEKRFVHDALFC
jgi:hypothetical protein